MYCKKIYLAGICLIIILQTACSVDNPKTQNMLLRNKRIAWSEGEARFCEFLPDGTFIAVGGDYPQEGYSGGAWESVDEKGNFKLIPDAALIDTFLVAKMETTMEKGASFVFEYFDQGIKVEPAAEKHTIVAYDELEKNHTSSAVTSKAIALTTRYADNVYVFEVIVEDPAGVIKKILLEGDHITTEVMVTNAKRWLNNPPVILPQGWEPGKAITSSITIQYYNGDTEKATFLTKRYKDNTSRVFEDAWY